MSQSVAWESVKYGERIQLTRDTCTFLERAGMLPERYELIDGEAIGKVGQNHEHALAVMRVLAYLLTLVDADRVRTQATMEVAEEDRSRNHPEPDALVLRETVNQIPDGTQVLLVVEVCDTSQRRDYGAKYGLYARAGVSEYWILDLERRLLVVYRNPDAVAGTWAEPEEFSDSDSAAPLFAPTQPVSVHALLP